MRARGTAVRGKAVSLLLPLAAVLLALAGGPTRAAPPGSPWGADYFPNVTLTTQDGKKVRFYDDLIKDKVFAINFIFTHCPDSCPLETASLRRVQQALGEQFGRDVFFYSISIDPARDTPQVLKEYAARFKAGPGWLFLTGNKDDILLLRTKLGLAPDEAAKARLSAHDTTILLGNEPAGKWIKRSPFEDTQVLARLLGTSMQSNRAAPAGSGRSYAEAKPLPNFSRGEYLFRTRCDSCHGMDTQDGIGPGLAGVTRRRERAWLERWLKEPDRMLAEKDPIATGLLERYNGVVMPNLRLNDVDVEALIGYLESPGAPHSAPAQ